MSGDRYQIHDQQATYFLTFTVVEWIDVFSRPEYRDVVVDSLNYCSKEKGLRLNAWVIMTNHIHLVAKCKPAFGISGFIRDFKKFTNKKIIEQIGLVHESRREWLLDKFSFEARRTGRAKNFKLWKDDNHAILIDNSIDIWEKINYVHENPVQARWVDHVADYVYSSAGDYAGKKGLVLLDLVD
ncbi:MAG: transposase [Reichenbachiella sp.]|uniref:REP-associated tyrosine transposase n=1 Tax=Reichenbachiella sp. TaxID=2184521 RepID=UPI003264D477